MKQSGKTFNASVAPQRAGTRQRQRLFETLKPVAEGISSMFGPNCEVVLHDFSDPERSIVAVAGNVTGRKVGGSVTEIGLALIARGDEAEDQIGYLTRSRDDKVIKSSTLLLRDEGGQVFGALCINLDVTELRALGRRLSQFAGPAVALPTEVDFSDNFAHVLQSIIDQEASRFGRALDIGDKADRMRIVAALDRSGAFAVQRSASLVAERLNVSRATVYAYLHQIRRTQSDQRDLDSGPALSLLRSALAVGTADSEKHVLEEEI